MMGMTEKAEVGQADAIMLINKISRPPCHPKRSEGSLALGREMLSAAKHDKAVTFPDVQIIS